MRVFLVFPQATGCYNIYADYLVYSGAQMYAWHGGDARSYIILFYRGGGGQGQFSSEKICKILNYAKAISAI